MEQIAEEVQPKRAEFHHGWMSFVSGLLLQIGQSSAFQVTPIIFAEDSANRNRELLADADVLSMSRLT